MNLERGLPGGGVQLPDFSWKNQETPFRETPKGNPDVQKYTTEGSLQKAGREISTIAAERARKFEKEIIPTIPMEFTVTKGKLAAIAIHEQASSIIENIDAGFNDAGATLESFRFVDEDNAEVANKILDAIIEETDGPMQKKLSKQLGALLQDGEFPKFLANEN